MSSVYDCVSVFVALYLEAFARSEWPDREGKGFVCVCVCIAFTPQLLHPLSGWAACQTVSWWHGKNERFDQRAANKVSIIVVRVWSDPTVSWVTISLVDILVQRYFKWWSVTIVDEVSHCRLYIFFVVTPSIRVVLTMSLRMSVQLVPVRTGKCWTWYNDKNKLETYTSSSMLRWECWLPTAVSIVFDRP